MLGSTPAADSAGDPNAELADLVRDLLPVSNAVGRAQTHGLDDLLPQVYDELRRLAASYLRSERPDHTLQPTALVHEVYLRLAGDKPVDWQDRAHLLGVSARIMRRVLADSAAARCGSNSTPRWSFPTNARSRWRAWTTRCAPSNGWTPGKARSSSCASLAG